MRLPWPTEFGRSPRWPIAAILFFGVGSLYYAAIAVGGMSAGDGIRAIFGASGLLLSALFVALSALRLRPHRPTSAGRIMLERNESGETAIALPMAHTSWFLGVLLCLSGGLFLVMLAVTRIASHSNGPAHTLLAIPLLAAALAAFAVAALLSAALRTPRRLVLSEHGVRQNNGALDQHLPWSAITAMTPTRADPTGGQSRRRIPMVLIRPHAPSDIAVPWRFRWFRQRTFLDVISVQPIAYPVDGGLLYYTLQFYWQHPELRPELASGAAIERMRRGDVLG
ncbi:hypothetical protein GPX89_03075 [Nocardia sp. ET3-3]|uniref:Uncharacterized protein n=1 Tax=Nocardia terrae TaxID=2675851 RepID=A0A7K1UPF6_9NOCA|nr:hypothetical protein [Nocardia terrae]MVU76222.1 hypothetical protein [Nocardia terrae]